MRVKVHLNASTNYYHRCYRHARPDCEMLHRLEFAKMLEAVEGQWLEVETEYLFSDQFNTVPIPGVSENGLRLVVADIVDIQGDVRQGIDECGWCGHHQPSGNATCFACGEDEYLLDLAPIGPTEWTVKKYGGDLS